MMIDWSYDKLSDTENLKEAFIKYTNENQNLIWSICIGVMVAITIWSFFELRGLNET